MKMQDKKRLAELELEAIKAQINPHFIYNCLNSIQYLNYKAEHEQAQQYLDLFARLIRMTMQYSQQAFIPIREEIDYLSLYLQLEKLRFKDKMHYRIHIEDGINKEAVLPAMLIQPYVENALKHGIAGKEKGEIVICFWEEAGKLQITVQDNGPGFAGLKRQGALGLRLAGTRAASYNELFNLNINIHCYNKQDMDSNVTGAVVHIGMVYLFDSTYGKSKVD
jgi:LytS/YehU family sensor histidine kinase